MNKKALQLMYEYLKRSDDYKEFCMWQLQRQRNPNKKIPLPKKFRAPKNRMIHPIAEAYLEYGDVHTLSFAEFYNNMQSSKSVFASTDIIELADVFKGKSERFITSFKTFNGREPNIHELVNYWQNIFENQLGSTYLRIYHVLSSTTELQKLFGKSIRKKKKDPMQKEFNKLSRQYGGLTSKHIRYDELKMYLKVYDLWKETDSQGRKLYKMKDIIKKVGTKADIAKLKSADAGSVLRKYQIYRAKAEKIIRNVEKGYFPGEY